MKEVFLKSCLSLQLLVVYIVVITEHLATTAEQLINLLDKRLKESIV